MPSASLLCIVVDFIVYCIVVETLDPHIWVSFIMDQSRVQSGQTSIMWLQFLSLCQSAQGPPTLYQTIDSYICPGHAISKAKIGGEMLIYKTNRDLLSTDLRFINRKC